MKITGSWRDALENVGLLFAVSVLGVAALVSAPARAQTGPPPDGATSEKSMFDIVRGLRGRRHTLCHDGVAPTGSRLYRRLATGQASRA